MLKKITSENFKSEVLESSKPVLVDFYANWCGPCKMIAPILEKISLENEMIDVAKIDIDQNEELAYSYGIQSIPTLVLIKEGKEVDRIIGLVSETEILNIVNKNIK